MSFFPKASNLFTASSLCILLHDLEEKNSLTYTVAPGDESPDLRIQLLSSVFSFLGVFTNSNCVSVSFIRCSELPIHNNPTDGL